MNDRQRSDWDGDLGARWTRNQDPLDGWLEPIGAALIAALAPVPGERVVDVGCGCGASALEIARRVAPGGAVLGVDVSHVMLERARQRAAEASVVVELRVADAAEADLGAGRWDALHSRFGLMFFDDPVAAFARMRAGLRAGGRIAFACWQARERNQWATLPTAVVDSVVGPAEPVAPGPGPFALADRTAVAAVLEGAGFSGVRCDDLRRSMPAGTTAEAYELFGTQVGPAARRLREVPEPGRGSALRALRDAFSEWAGDDGIVRFDAAAWIVTATA